MSHLLERLAMRNFDVEEHLIEDGAAIVITAKHGLTFDDGSTTKEIVLRSDYGPRIGERVMCGKVLVKVLQKRYDSEHRVQLLDEDTRAWFIWEGNQ